MSIEAEHYTSLVNSKTAQLKVIPDIGRDGSGLSEFPVTAASRSLSISAPHTDYRFFTYDSGKLNVDAYFSPTLNFRHDGGLQYAIAIDDENPEIITINKEDDNKTIWGEWVANNIIIKKTAHFIAKPGMHVLKYWSLGPGPVLQKMVIDLGDLKPSYLGPPETLLDKK